MRRCSRADWVVDGRVRLAGPDLTHKVSPVNACQQDASAREPTQITAPRTWASGPSYGDVRAPRALSEGEQLSWRQPPAASWIFRARAHAADGQPPFPGCRPTRAEGMSECVPFVRNAAW